MMKHDPQAWAALPAPAPFTLTDWLYGIAAAVAGAFVAGLAVGLFEVMTDPWWLYR